MSYSCTFSGVAQLSNGGSYPIECDRCPCATELNGEVYCSYLSVLRITEATK